jgi:hypothetical protein
MATAVNALGGGTRGSSEEEEAGEELVGEDLAATNDPDVELAAGGGQRSGSDAATVDEDKSSERQFGVGS